MSMTTIERRPTPRRSLLALAGLGAATLTAGSLLLAPAALAAPAAPPAGTTDTAAADPAADPTTPDAGTADQALNAGIEPSVVQLYIEWSGYVGIPDEAGTIWSDELSVASICTGFFVSDTGQIATAGHCVDPVEGRHSLVDSFLEGTVADGTLTPEEAAGLVDAAYSTWPVEGLDAGSEPQRIVYAVQPKAVDGIVIEDPLAVQLVDYRSFDEGDVALLKADVTGTVPLPVSTSDPTSGMAVTSVGFPASVQSVVDASRVRASFKTGSVSSQQISELGVPRTEINADLSGGMSGGPTVDSLGNVVGVNSSKIIGDQAFNFITDASDLHDWLTAKGVTLTAANVPAAAPSPAPVEELVAAQVSVEDEQALAVGLLVAGAASVFGFVVTVGLVVVLVVRRRRKNARRAVVAPPAPIAAAPLAGPAGVPSAVPSAVPDGVPAMAGAPVGAAHDRPLAVVDSIGSVTFGPQAPVGAPAPFGTTPHTPPTGPTAVSTTAPVSTTPVAAPVGFTAQVGSSAPALAAQPIHAAQPVEAAPAAGAAPADLCRGCGAPGVAGQRFCGSCGVPL